MALSGLLNRIWLKKLNSTNLWTRYDAMQHIKKSGDIELLTSILKQNVKVPGNVGGVWHSSMSSEAFSYFKNHYEIIPEDIILILFSNLKTSDSLVRREVYENLGWAYEKSTNHCKIKIMEIIKKGLIEEKNDPARQGVEDAVSHLRKAIPFDEYKKIRIPILLNRLEWTRYVDELISLTETDAVPYLQDALKSPNYEIRENAKWGMDTLKSGLYQPVKKW